MIRIDFLHPKIQREVEAEAPSEVPSPGGRSFSSRSILVPVAILIVVALAAFIYVRMGRRASPPPSVGGPPQEVAERPPEEAVREPAPSEEVPEERAAAPLEFRYTVQVAAWEDVGDAHMMADFLRNRGYDARVETADIPGRGVYHRVRVGYFTDYDRAQAAAEELRSKFGCDIWIVSLEEE